MDKNYVELLKEMDKMEEKHIKIIAFLIIAFILVIFLNERYINVKWHEKLEEKYNKVYSITQEMRKEIIELAEENDYFIQHYNKYTIDDFHNSTAFEEVLGEFENDIEDIGW